MESRNTQHDSRDLAMMHDFHHFGVSAVVRRVNTDNQDMLSCKGSPATSDQSEPLQLPNMFDFYD